MSLVSYAESDDSGDEDISEPEIQKNVEKNSDETVTIDKTGLQTKTAVQTKTQQGHTDNDGSKTTKPKSIGSLFSSLPAPWMSTVTWASKSSEKKQPTIKITMPSLDDNSDSDDENYVKKTVTGSSEKPSGLFSLLPKPKHSVVVKENNPNRPVAKISNRPLIPDSLQRKQKKPTPQVKKPSAKDDGSDDGSDDDDGGGGSFFSWNEPTSLASNALSNQGTSDAASTVVAGPVGQPSVATKHNENNERVLPSMKITNDANMTQETKNTENIETFPQASTVSTTDSFNNQNIYTHTQEYSYQGTNNLGEYSGSYPTNSENIANPEQNFPYCDHYNSEQYNQAMPEQNYPTWQMPAQPSNQETSEQFKKLLGKRGRGEESIDIIDVNGDDQVASSQEWKTNYQKEDADYKPQSKKKGNLPSSQQRRKHQITYLAFQAKEKEWELRNQWSANRQTRRQTQSKYGF
mgnify:CR=1 FL=1